MSWASRREARWSEGAGEAAGAVVEVRGWPVSWHMDKAWEPHLSVCRAQSTVHSISLCYNSRSLRRSIPVLRHFSCILHWKKASFALFASILYSQDLLMYSSLHTLFLRFSYVLFSSISEIITHKAILIYSCLAFVILRNELFSGKLHLCDLIHLFFLIKLFILYEEYALFSRSPYVHFSTIFITKTSLGLYSQNILKNKIRT